MFRMPQKIVVATLALSILLTSLPFGALAQDVSPARQAKIDQIEAAIEREQNHPFALLWRLFTSTTVSGFLLDRIWTLFQNYEENQRYQEATELKEGRVNNTIKESPNTTVKTYNGQVVPSKGNMTAPSTGTSKPTAPGGTPSVDTKGGATSGQTIPTGDDKEEEEEDDITTKSGSAVITSFEAGMSGITNWFSNLVK